MRHLAKYEAARTALAEAHQIDEVKDIRDKAEAMAAYARQAKDTELIQWATEIKVRAERRAGQMLSDSLPVTRGRENVAKSLKSSGSHDTTPAATLADIGVSKDQSSRWQKLGAMPEDQFETAVATAKEVAGEVSTAYLLREAKKSAGNPPKPTKPKTDHPDPDDKLRARIAELESEVADLREHNETLKQQAVEVLADNESMARVFESDEKLVTALAEAKRYREMNRLLEERVRGMQGEMNAAIRSAKGYKAKLDKMERAAA